MTLAHKVMVVAAIVLSIFLTLVACEWLKEHDARLETEKQVALQQQSINTLQTAQQTAQAALITQVKAIEQQKTQPATAAQILTEAQTLGIALPEPLKVQPDPSLPNSPEAQQVVIPAADFKAIRDAELTCQEDQAKLATCNAVNADQATQLKLTETQRDEWEKTAKGGSVWHRVLTTAKYVGIGAAIGAGSVAIAYEINRQNGLTINSLQPAVRR